MITRSLEEGYENGLEVKYNSSEQFAGQREREIRLLEEKGCMGRSKRAIFALMQFLLATEPILQGVVVVTSATGTFFSALKAGVDPDTAFLDSWVAGMLAFFFLFLVWWATYRYGVFVDKESRKRIRNELSCCVWVGYFISIVMFVISCYLLYNIRNYCPKDVACNLKGVFIPDNSTISNYLP
jgi:hypothetical protein